MVIRILPIARVSAGAFTGFRGFADKQGRGRFEETDRVESRGLQTLATMDDLTKIRDSLVSSANELQDGVNQMVRDGEQVVARMRGELCQYRAKLEAAERLASVDSLTGLQNRSEERRVGKEGRRVGKECRSR